MLSGIKVNRKGERNLFCDEKSSFNDNKEASSQIIKPANTLFNEAPENRFCVPKEKKQIKKSINSAELVLQKYFDNRRASGPSCRKLDSSSDSDKKFAEHHLTKCESLKNIRNSVKRKTVSSPSPFTALSSTPSLCRGHADYLKEFDSILNTKWIGQCKQSCRSPENANRVFSFAPKTSPSEPIILKKRVYSLMPLSDPEMQVNAQNISSDAKSGSDWEDNDIYYCSVGDSASGRCQEDSIFDKESKHKLDNQHNASTSSILLVHEPITMKCVDESTNRINELVIYSDEFLAEVLAEKGDMASKKEIFESLIEQSTDYVGKSLRFIKDTKTFLSKLRDNRSKSEGDVRWSSPARIDQNTEQKALAKRRAHSTHNCTKICRNTTIEEFVEKRKKSYLSKFQLKQDIANQTYIIKSSAKRHSSLNASIPNTMRINNGSKGRPSGYDENDKRPRTALKKINVEEIISSNFRNYFSFFAKFRSRLKSGAAITKGNSNFWLKIGGIISDDHSERMAEECFDALARTKCVLNISDYIHYLITFARKQRIFIADVIDQLKSIDTQFLMKIRQSRESTA